jgi:hypothetical protein
MNESDEHKVIRCKISVPHESESRVICFWVALLVPYVSSLPDIPFGNWHLLMGGGTEKFHFDSFAAGALLLFFVNALSLYPVFLAGVAFEKFPLAYWLSLAAYLGSVIVGYGTVYRDLLDGLEVLGVTVIAAFAATCGAAIGLLLDKAIKNQSTQIWIVRIALTAAVFGSLSWSVIKASKFYDRKLERTENVRGTPQTRESDAIDSVSSTGNKSQLTCLGYASVDGSIRLFTENYCTRELKGKYYSNGECIKEHGGSYSWDLRWMNQRCP